MALPPLIDALRSVDRFVYHEKSQTVYLPPLPKRSRKSTRYENVSWDELEKILASLACFELDERDKKGYTYFTRAGSSEIASEESERLFDTTKE